MTYMTCGGDEEIAGFRAAGERIYGAARRSWPGWRPGPCERHPCPAGGAHSLSLWTLLDIQQTRASHVLMAATEAIERVPRLGPVLMGAAWSAALAEALVWLASIDDLLDSSAAYKTTRAVDPAGQTLRGLRYVRNLAIHGDEVVAVALSRPGAELGRLVLDISRLDTTSTFTWMPLDALPAPGRKQVPDLEPAYDAYVADHDVVITLSAALAFASREVALRWP